jgi:hypothetical protein
VATSILDRNQPAIVNVDCVIKVIARRIVSERRRVLDASSGLNVQRGPDRCFVAARSITRLLVNRLLIASRNLRPGASPRTTTGVGTDLVHDA